MEIPVQFSGLASISPHSPSHPKDSFFFKDAQRKSEMITGRFLHLMWTGILTWMWDSLMLQTPSSIRKPFLSNLWCDSEEPSLRGGPSHIWLPHILPVEHLGNKLPTPAHRRSSEWFQKKREGRMSTREMNLGCTKPALMSVTVAKVDQTHKTNAGSWVVSAKASMHIWRRGHISDLSPSTLRTCFGPSSQEKWNVTASA